MPIRNGKKVSGFPGLWIRSRDAIADAVIEFSTVNTAPTTTSGYYYLYVDSSGRLTFDNGSTTTIVGAAGGASTTWESLFLNDTTLAMTATGLTMSQSANAMLLTLTKSGTGAGDVFTINNAGTGDDFNISTTRATSTGVVVESHHNSATPADNDVLMRWEVNGEDDGSTETEYGYFQFRSTDVTDTTEDADFSIALMVTGTERTCLTIAGATTTIGSGAAAGTLTSSGNYDLVLQTGNATTGSITITDGAAGAIALAPDTTGVVTVSTGIQVGGTTATACTFATAGTTGASFSITTSTITSGDVLRVNHSSAATLNGGNLLALQVASSNVFTVGEDGTTTVVGTAAGTTALSITTGDFVVDDTDTSKFESEDGTGTLLTLDNKAGVIASDSAVLLVDAGGAVASGGNALRVIFSGVADAGAILAEFLPDAGSVGIKIEAGGVATQEAFYVDADPTATSVAYIHSDAVIADNKAIIEIDHATGASASGSNLLRIKEGATPNAGAIMFEMDVQKDCAAVFIDTDSATNDAFTISGAGALATGKAMFKVYNNGTPAAADSYLVLFDYSAATHTNNPVAVRIASGNTTAEALQIVHTGAGANNTGALSVTSSGAIAAGGSILRVTATGTPAAATSYLLDFDYSGATMTNNPVTMFLNAGSSTGSAVYVTGSGAGNSLTTYNTNTGATGVQWFTEHTSTGSAADNDVVFRLTMAGLDDADATNNYARIDVTAIDVSAASEDGKLDLQVAVGGTLTSLLYVQSSIAGATTLVSGAAASTFAGSVAGTAALTVTNGDISLSAGKFISTTTADIYGLDVTVNKATATQGVAVFTNASATSGKAVLELEQADLDQPYMKFSGSTAVTSASAGANGDVPAQVVGYLLVDVDGTNRKVPYYAS